LPSSPKPTSPATIEPSWASPSPIPPRKQESASFPSYVSSSQLD